jgi:hypothetical protein
MMAFRKPLAIACVGAAALAAQSLGSGSEVRSDLPRTEHVASAACDDRSAACVIAINYAYPAGDLSVVPPDVYF